MELTGKALWVRTHTVSCGNGYVYPSGIVFINLRILTAIRKLTIKPKTKSMKRLIFLYKNPLKSMSRFPF